MTRPVRSSATHQAPAVALAGPGLPDEAVAVLAARGILAEVPPGGEIGLSDAIHHGTMCAWAAAEPIDLSTARQLAAIGAEAAAGRPLVVLAPPVRGFQKVSVERAAALAHLRAHGVVVIADPDAWLEAIVLAAAIGVPRGTKVAVVAPPGSWLERAAAALAAEIEDLGRRAVHLTSAVDEPLPFDVVIVDAAAAPTTQPARALVVPTAARAELVDARAAPVLVGLRAALGAVTACGRAAERIEAGLGAAPRTASAELEIDRERVERQLARMVAGDRRLGDHEAKVLLAAYGAPVIRQAVATTPSAAVRLAKKAGYPVEAKPWGPDIPSERAGCPVERNLATAADVRRGCLAVFGQGATSETAVIIRETPPPGREVVATLQRMSAVGWVVVLEVPGVGAPLAAPAPLRVADAMALVQAVTATRAGEPEPDRVALANLLRRASHLAVDLEDRVESIELGRIVVAPKGGRTMIVDAAIALRGDGA